MDASRHGPKKGGPIGPMGSTISPFKYYVIYYQTLFKHFRAAGLPSQTGRPAPIKLISGRAWAGTSVHGQARHGPLIFSCLSGSYLNKPCLDGPMPGQAGPPVWPPIACAAPESDSQNAHRSSPHGIGMNRAGDSTIKRLSPQVLSKTKHKKQESSHASHANPLLLTAIDTQPSLSLEPLTLCTSPVRSNPLCAGLRRAPPPPAPWTTG